MKIIQNSAVIFKGDAISNVMRNNDKLFKEKGWTSNLCVDLFSEISNVLVLASQDYDTTPLIARLIYLFSRFIRLDNKIGYLKQYLQAKKQYIRLKARQNIEEANIRIWHYGGYYKLFDYFHEKDIIFYAGITYPYLTNFAVFSIFSKQSLLNILDMQPFFVVYSNFIKEGLVDFGFKSKNIHILPLFHKFNLNYIKHKHNIVKLLTYGRYATNKAIPELAKTCNENKISLLVFGDNNQTLEFKTNYNKAKEFETKIIKILPKQPEIDNFFKESNIFISNSYHEGFLMPAIESMAHSLPILIRKGTAPDDFYTDKKHLPGLQFTNITEIPKLINKILKNYDFYSYNAYNLSKKYTLNIYKKRLFDILNIYLKWK